MHRHPAGVAVESMLPEINALPGAEGQSSVGNRDGEIGRGQGGADMGRHVIRAFASVFEQGIAVGNQAREKTFEIQADLGVGIFLDDQRSGGVLHVQGGQAGPQG